MANWEITNDSTTNYLRAQDQTAQNPIDFYEDGTVESPAVNTGSVFTESRGYTYIVHKDDNGNLYCDGPDGPIISKGDWDGLANELPTVVSDSDSVFFANDRYYPTGTLSFDTPVSLFANGAYMTPDDDSFGYLFKSNISSTSGPVRRRVQVSGFRFNGLADSPNNFSHGFYKLAGDLVNCSIHNNTLNNCELPAIQQTGSGHVMQIFANSATSANDLFADLDGSGYNSVWGNDAGGGIRSAAFGTNWIGFNSVFESGTDGIILSERDICHNNLVIDNANHGIKAAGKHHVSITDNISMNNSTASDNTYSGIQLLGSNSAVSDFVLSGNICWNRDPTLGGSGNGLQAYGINIDGTLKNGLIDNNTLTGNESGPLNYNSPTLTNVKITSNNIGPNYDAGTTRPPHPFDGMQFFDDSLGKPIWWDADASAWKDATGSAV